MSSLIPIRLVLIIAGCLTGMLFVVGILFWNTKEYACLQGKHYYGDYMTVMSVGKLELRFKQWGCDNYLRYDPSQFKTGVPNLQYVPTQ